MIEFIGAGLNRLLRKTGYEIVRSDQELPDIDTAARAMIKCVRPFTMLSAERIVAFRDAVLYVDRFNIPGSIVECGVWRGGSIMAAARTLLDIKALDRELYLFDTFEGMTEPTDVDYDIRGVLASSRLAHTHRLRGSVWAYASLEDVRRNVLGTGYPAARVHFVKGPVEETLPDQAPEEIAVLRLDTDWYESTKHELTHLIPRLARNGVLIIDDYGYWKGARKAVDEFLEASDRPILLNRTDRTGRIAMLP